MPCGHCIRGLTTAIHAEASKADVHIDPATGRLEVRTTLKAAQVIALVREEGYQAESAMKSGHFSQTDSVQSILIVRENENTS
ncbi:hypothetical protein L4G45_01855 [Pseudomonas sp. P2498]|nr:hypothetical protein [Pseudomonas petrae]MCF7536635.1 hypothetical protein [Pseudomonas petrae]MCF7554315.1 hypothetical protein [Pseudomonas petrae]